MSTISISNNFAEKPLQEQLEEFAKIDLYSEKRPHSQYIDNVIVPLLMLQPREATISDEFNRAPSLITQHVIMPKIVGKIEKAINLTIPESTSESVAHNLVAHKRLSRKIQKISNTKFSLRNALSASSIYEKAKNEALLEYFYIVVNGTISQTYPILDSFLYQLSPIIQEEIIKVISEKTLFDRLHEELPEQFHNMIRLPLLNSNPYINRFRRLLSDVDRCSKEQKATLLKSLQEPSLTEIERKSVLGLIERWESLQKDHYSNLFRDIFEKFLTLHSRCDLSA